MMEWLEEVKNDGLNRFVVRQRAFGYAVGLIKVSLISLVVVAGCTGIAVMTADDAFPVAAVAGLIGCLAALPMLACSVVAPIVALLSLSRPRRVSFEVGAGAVKLIEKVKSKYPDSMDISAITHVAVIRVNGGPSVEDVEADTSSTKNPLEILRDIAAYASESSAYALAVNFRGGEVALASFLSKEEAYYLEERFRGAISAASESTEQAA